MVAVDRESLYEDLPKDAYGASHFYVTIMRFGLERKTIKDLKPATVK